MTTDILWVNEVRRFEQFPGAHAQQLHFGNILNERHLTGVSADWSLEYLTLVSFFMRSYYPELGPMRA